MSFSPAMKTFSNNTLMKSSATLFVLLTLANLSSAQEDVPLLLPEERQAIARQDREFNEAIAPALTTAARSTVRIWAGKRRLAYGTVIGDGKRILSKWSEIARASEELRIDAGEGDVRSVKLSGVYQSEDLVVLEVEGAPLQPVSWSTEETKLGSFLAAPQPDGRLAAFGVVSVLERNLRDTDLAYLGIVAVKGFAGPGVKIELVDPKSGAAAAGLVEGDVILKVGDRSISGLLELRNALTGVAPGEKVSVVIETDKREKRLEVAVGNRPERKEYFGARLQQMERMGGAISQIRDSFSHVIQSDMILQPNQIGGPVVDLKGRVVGITMARADRTRSFIMPGADVENLLKQDPANPALAQVRDDEEEAKPMPARNGKPQGRKPKVMSEERLRRHLSDMQRLMDYMNEEIEALEEP